MVLQRRVQSNRTPLVGSERAEHDASGDQSKRDKNATDISWNDDAGG